MVLNQIRTNCQFSLFLTEKQPLSEGTYSFLGTDQSRMQSSVMAPLLKSVMAKL